MDFAVVQAPSVNEGYSTFCTGLDLTGHLLFVHFVSDATFIPIRPIDLRSRLQGDGV
jgi:hypothetical protein